MEISRSLARLLKERGLPLDPGPLADEYVWQMALRLTDRGSRYEGAIPLEEIETRMPAWGREGWRYCILKIRVQLEALDKRSRAHKGWFQALDGILAGAARGGDDAALANAVNWPGPRIVSCRTVTLPSMWHLGITALIFSVGSPAP